MNTSATPPTKDYKSRRLIVGYLSLFALLFVSTIAVIPLFFIYNFDTEAVTAAITATLIATLVAEVIVIVGGLGVMGELKNWRDILGFKRSKLKHLAIGAGVGLAAMIGLQIISFVVNALGFATENSDTSNAVASLEGAERILVLFVLVPFVVPFVEEVLFRGLTLTAILRGHEADPKNLKARGTVLAIVVSSLFFALAHFQGFSSVTDFMVVAWTFVFAIFNSILRLKCDSIFPAYASHLTYNLVTAGVLAVM